MRLRRLAACAAACLLAAAIPLTVAVMQAQEREDRTLLSSEQMRAIINEASGERAMHHLLELVPYQRVRHASEYGGTLRESEVMVRFAKEYGYSNVRVETFPGNPQWQPSVGELWMTATGLPGGATDTRKLYDIHDIALALGQGTPTGDVSGDLVDAGACRAQDYDGKDLTGKVVLCSNGVGTFQAAQQKGAVGVLGYTALRPTEYSNQILRGLHQAGGERRQLRVRADARDRTCVHQAHRRREAAPAEAHDQLPVAARDQRHECLAERPSRQGEGHHRNAEL